MASRADQPTPWGAHSEVGRLRRAMVCRPGRAQLRVKSRQHGNLAGDGVLWVERAEQEHAQLVGTLRERGVEVLELHTLLAQALASPEARQWAIAHRLGRAASGWSLQGELQAALTDLPPDQLADIPLPLQAASAPCSRACRLAIAASGAAGGRPVAPRLPYP